MTHPGDQACQGDRQLVLGSLVGYRRWITGGDGWLRGWDHHERWQTGVSRSTCWRLGRDGTSGWFPGNPQFRPSGEVRLPGGRVRNPCSGMEVGCSCGYWAYTDVTRAVQGVSDVIGAIEGTGRVVVGPAGFRAERARILAILPRSAWYPYKQAGDDKMIAAVGKRYGVPVLEHPGQLTAEFPASDLSTLVAEG